jgi:hypothetical protein
LRQYGKDQSQPNRDRKDFEDSLAGDQKYRKELVTHANAGLPQFIARSGIVPKPLKCGVRHAFAIANS